MTTGELHRLPQHPLTEGTRDLLNVSRTKPHAILAVQRCPKCGETTRGAHSSVLYVKLGLRTCSGVYYAYVVLEAVTAVPIARHGTQLPWVSLKAEDSTYIHSEIDTTQ